MLPSLAIDTDPNDVHISYYTQHTDATVDLDMANSHDRGDTFPVNRAVRVTSTSSALPPTNIPLSNAPAFNATSYDRQIAVYALGEYQSVAWSNGSVYVGLGRRSQPAASEAGESAEPDLGPDTFRTGRVRTRRR